MGSISVTFDDKNLKSNLKTFRSRMNARVAGIMQYNAPYTTGWLKQNAPWTDRTSAARTGLTTVAFTMGTTHELLMAYSVYYGIWLEVANSGRYAVITPAMRIVGKKVMDDMQMLIDSMGGR